MLNISRIWFVAVLLTMLIVTGCASPTVEPPESNVEERQSDIDQILKGILTKADSIREIPQLKAVLDDSCPSVKE